MAAPTPYPEVNAVLAELLSGAQATLQGSFVGLYLYGSLASGDFNPSSSDIDFVVVTDGELSEQAIQALESLHARLAASGLAWAPKLEGAYVPRATLRRHDPAAAPCPQINEGRFYVAGLGSDWVIQRDILRRQGVVLAGPPLASLIDPVSPDDVRLAVMRIFREWWQPMLADHSWLQRSDYQAYAVLTMCRVLYTLQFGVVASKPVSARWAQQVCGPHFIALIEQALDWQHGDELDILDGSLAFIQYTLEEIEQYEQPADDD